MKPTPFAPGFLAVAALLATAATAGAQSPNAAAGPTGQAAAQTQSVNVVNTPTVLIGNTPTVTIGTPVTVQEMARTPMYVVMTLDPAIGAYSLGSKAWTVPAGQRFVVETVSSQCSFSAANTHANLWAYVDPGAPLVTLIPPASPFTNVNYASWMAETVPVRLMIDGGDSLHVGGQRDTASGIGTCTFSFSGYLTAIS